MVANLARNMELIPAENLKGFEAERLFDFSRCRDGWQRGNQLPRESMLRAEKDRMRRIAFHDFAGIDQRNAMAKPIS
jgi:hypothetical protein